MLKSNSLAILLLVGAISGIGAGPMKRLSRMTREIYPEIEPENEGNQAQVCIVGDVVYGVDEIVPAEQPCLKCRCQPPGVQCETVQCTKKPGCKAIHRPNTCCPDYQCECEHNNRLYGNGERLETPPGGECKVCYCRGGEVQCAEVSCYIRNDCEGKTVAGKCCPKYDHCPPIDAVPDRSLNATDMILPNIAEEIYENWPITGIPPNVSDINYQEDNKIVQTIVDATTNDKLPKNTEIEIDNLEIDDKPLTRITIHEIIPEIKEIPITAEPKVDDPQGQLLIEENLTDSSNDLLVTDSEPDSSEILEVFHPPPPVLRVGDKLIYLKQGHFNSDDSSTPNSVITIIGAEGLQRGGVDDSAEVHEKTFTSTRETTLFGGATNDLEPKTSESTHILSLLKKKKIETTTTMEQGPTTTTEVPILSSTSEESSTESSTSLTESDEVTTELASTTNGPTIFDELVNETISLESLENATDSSTVAPTLKTTIERNPAYPVNPEVMSSDDASPRFEATANSTEDTDMKILPEVLEIRNNKTIPENSTNSEWLKNESSTEPDTLINYRAALPESILNQFAPSDYDVSNSSEVNNSSERSVESLENGTTEESGEFTTSKSAAVISKENVSVEKVLSETEDMLSATAEVTDNASTESDKTTPDVEMIDVLNKPEANKTEVVEKDVETFPVTEKSVTTEVAVETTERPEELPKPEKIVDLPLKLVGKRENTAEAESDEVFKQLESELLADTTERIQSKAEEQREADDIFRELLEETSTPKGKIPLEGRTKEEQMLQRVSDALAQLTLKGKQADSNILGVLSNFFSSQYRYYKK